MSKRQFKSHASSSRAGAFEGFGGSSAFGANHHESVLSSYITEYPDFSSISNPNLVVVFKNLTKKDGTTKAKALEDLQTHVSQPEADVEDGILDAWVTLFPRLTIEPNRRVRQLCHVVNGHICSKCGKRTVKHMPRISGPWLAGLHDSDRATARAAQDSLRLVFPTADKVHGVRKTFQRSILEFCRDAILDQTVNTLTDERTVNRDDAEATWARVMSSTLAVIGTLMRDLSAEEQAKSLDLHEEIIADDKFWAFATSSDAGVRRAMHRVVQIYLDVHPEVLQDKTKAISTSYVYKGLPSDQTGSAVNFTQTLNALATKLPSVWTDAYSGKKPVASRLKTFLKHGSQSSAATFWDSLSELLRNVPVEIFPSSKDDIVGLLVAARSGVALKEERFNASSAWPAYFTLVDVMTKSIASGERDEIFDSEVMPLIRQYLEPNPETTEWSIGGARPGSIIAKVATIETLHPKLISEWPGFGDKLVETAKTSQPEQSKEFEKSQKHVATCGERWANLQRELFDGQFAFSQDSLQAMEAVNVTVLRECVSLLQARNGKPFGAAAIIEEQLRTCGARLMSVDDYRTAYTSFAEKEIPHLIFGPSQRHLIRGLFAISTDSMFKSAFTAILNGILSADVAIDQQLGALKALLTNSTPKEAATIAKESSEFQEFVSRNVSSPTSAAGAVGFFSEVVGLGVTTEQTTDQVLADITNSLTLNDRRSDSLSALDTIASNSHGIVQSFMSRSGGPGEQLLPLVLQLEQSPDESTAEKASALASKLSSVIGDASSEAKYSALMQNLERVSARSLPMDAIFDLMDRLLGPEKKIDDPSEIIPSLDVWQSSIEAALRSLKASMALSSPMGGVVHFMKRESNEASVTYDVEGLSQALRIAMYMARLLSQNDVLQDAGEQTAFRALALLHVSVLATEDNLSILGNNEMWSARSGPEMEAIVLDFVSEANAVIRKQWNQMKAIEGFKDFLFQSWQSAESDASSTTAEFAPLVYYESLAFGQTTAHVLEQNGHSNQTTEQGEAQLKRFYSQHGCLGVVATAIAFQQSLSGTTSLHRVCNELVADLREVDVSKKDDKALRTLVVLNSILQTQEDAAEIVPKHRVIFLVKHVLPWLAEDVSAAIKSEVFRVLTMLLPDIHDMYGEHWEETLAAVLSQWTSVNGSTDGSTVVEDNILLASTSLRLFAALKKLSTSQEPNDDIVEAIQEKKADIETGLLRLLKNESNATDEMHLPLRSMHELLGRQVSALDLKKLDDVDELYPLMYAPSYAVQQAAFSILHQYIPTAQEQISLDAALDNKTAQIPDELLSLILETPTLDSLADASFDRRMPLSLQGYLSSWRLIFDHFTGSSHRVRGDYTEQLKEGTYLSGLLTFTFDFLGHSRGKPIDASKFSIDSYTPDIEPSPERDVQWLLTHLYYQALTHLPGLVKTFHRDLRSRQTVQAVETWTAKHLSPLVIASALADVGEWARTSVAEDPEYEKMTVRVGGAKSREVNVGYLVDEQTMAIRVVLPEAYPLESARVQGINRVAVKEDQWQSWLRNCQGVITFSNGSITDGLAAWRRNVTGALKGQTECAICYSIISADKQLPTKRCPTCKHLFHSSCLFKWFKTSNANTCPLCRNPFQFN